MHHYFQHPPFPLPFPPLHFFVVGWVGYLVKRLAKQLLDSSKSSSNDSSSKKINTNKMKKTVLQENGEYTKRVAPIELRRCPTGKTRTLCGQRGEIRQLYIRIDVIMIRYSLATSDIIYLLP